MNVEQLSIIVLAGGYGSRFGGNKLEHIYREKPLLLHAVHNALSTPVSEIIIVLGNRRFGLHGILDADPKVASDERIKIVYAANWSQGMSASLNAGLADLKLGSLGCFVVLADMPHLPQSVFSDLAAMWKQGLKAIVPTHNGKRGHPVLMHSDLYSTIMAQEGDIGAREVLNALGSALLETDASEGVIFDIDTVDDLNRMQARFDSKAMQNQSRFDAISCE